MEVIAIMGLVGLTGYLLKTNETVSGKVPNMPPLEKPNSLNMYNSDYVNAANNETLMRATQKYKDSEDAYLTGVLPPLYNSYNAVGNDSILNAPYKPLNKVDTNNINRLNLPIKSEPLPSIHDRPMFQSLSKLQTQNESVNFSNFGSGQSATQDISLLTGQVIEKDHNNMLPFFGSNTTQNVETFRNEAKLDSFTGNTSTFIHKKEQTPFFENYTENIYGTPLVTDLIEKDRFIPSVFRQGEKPFNEERFAAPIADTLDNPMSDAARNVKTIDQLRAANKPQITYGGILKTGQYGNVRGIQGHLSKNAPETSFELGQDRFFVTTGAIVSNKMRENYENFQDTSRQSQNIEYYGSAKQLKKSSPGQDCNDLTANYQDSTRQQLNHDSTRNVNTQFNSANHDYGKSSINLPELERDTTNKMHTLNVNVKDKGHQMKLQDTLKNTIKETTLTTDNFGNIKSTLIKNKNTGLTDYNTKTTHKETFVKNNKYRGQASKNDGMGYNIAKYNAKTTHSETTLRDYSGNAIDINKSSMVYSTFQDPQKIRHAVHAQDYTGVIKSQSNDPENRIQFDNAEISSNKEELLQGERPSGKNSSLQTISIGADALGDIKFTENMMLKESEKNRIENLDRFSQNIPTKSTIGEFRNENNNLSEIDAFSTDPSSINRFNGNFITEQLKNNPYYNLN